MEISTVCMCQDTEFECETETEQAGATQWIHAKTHKCDRAEETEHRGCCIRYAHCDSDVHRQEMGQVEIMPGICDKWEISRQCLTS